MRRRAMAACATTVLLGILVGCASAPPPQRALGYGYPGTCLPDQLRWPTDFLESLPGESTGTVVGLRLEYLDEKWAWRVRSVTGNDPARGEEALLDVQTLEKRASHEVDLTDAEQRADAPSAGAAAQQSGETYPSPLIIDMKRIVDDGAPAWQVTTCDTETSAQAKVIVR
ncbi:hypothetical protein [Microbacterium sp. NPDC089188]|uniref:hypothetical protein n=1 Tax=Microbacterium sp. NPDC089188 TaxID=3154971 RepID=UPI00341523BA